MISLWGKLLCLCLVTSLVAGDNSTKATASCDDINNVKDQCSFAQKTDACAIDEGFINYVVTAYCKFSGVIPLGVVIFILWWLFLFLALAVTADDFFCPSLTVMAKVLRMSDNIAGVTLLAFGNGAPDIFSAIAAIGNMKNGSDAGLAFGALLGAGVFVTAVVSGAVIISKPFQCMERPLLRDITFYIGAVFYTFYIMQSKKINTLEAVGFLIIYIAYVLVVVIGRYIRKQSQTPDSQPVVGDRNDHRHPVAVLDTDPNAPTTMSKHLAEKADYDEGSKLHHGHHHQDTHYHNIQERGRREATDNKAITESGETEPLLPGQHEETSAVKEFLDAINPICREEWMDKKWYGKVYMIVKAPIQFILTITCPVVDEESEKNNWNRHLSALQILIGPIFSIFATNQYGVMLGDKFPLWALFLCVFAVLSALSFYTSSNATPPKWHKALSFLGFIVACVWIYCIANEIVNILQLFGVFFRISDAILGLTLLAWGNSIGDLIADTALARRGYPRIGISACFGGPLFNLLIGVGLPFTIACVKNGGEMALDFSFELVVLTGGLTISLLSTYIAAPFILKFFMKRWFGIYLLCVYVAFLLTAILTETGVITIDVSSW
ncbi:mitochondrial sodium/calcium exchanger protein-like [Watersipora subatra]|uniref:mitochondrial sodium/calcium exchanger protein-like n=1 Tax=Watersipora subatra TaxID=2589382 RepID=UPI00355C645D